MRRLKSRNKRNKKNSIIITIAFVLLFVCSTGYALLSEKLGVKGIVRLNTGNPECSIHKFNGYHNFEHEISYEIYDTNNGHNVHATITVTNTGDKYVNRWRSYLILPEGYIKNDVYNCKQVFEGDADIYENPNENYNNVIEPGKSIKYDVSYTAPTDDYKIKDVETYGFNSNVEKIPTIADMSHCLNGGEPTDPDEEETIIAVTAADKQKWDDTVTHTNTTLTITNKSSKDVEHWYIILDVGDGGSIPGCWSATCSQTGNQVKITQPSWKAIIPANGSISIDFQIIVPLGTTYKIVETGLLS